jgi:hypothetical protein
MCTLTADTYTMLKPWLKPLALLKPVSNSGSTARQTALDQLHCILGYGKITDVGNLSFL